MANQPTAPGDLAETPIETPPRGWTAVTAGVLACLGSAHRLLSVVVLIAGIMLLNDLDGAGETDTVTTLFLVTIPVFLVVGVLLLVGGVQMFRKKASARPLIAIGAAIDIAYSVIELVIVLGIVADGDYHLIGSPLFVALINVFPAVTIILTLTASTTRWLEYHGTRSAATPR